MHQQDTSVEMMITQVDVVQETREGRVLDYWLGKLVVVRNIVDENILRRFFALGRMDSAVT
jgi:hypothetical protein